MIDREDRRIPKETKALCHCDRLTQATNSLPFFLPSLTSRLVNPVISLPKRRNWDNTVPPLEAAFRRFGCLYSWVPITYCKQPGCPAAERQYGKELRHSQPALSTKDLNWKQAFQDLVVHSCQLLSTAHKQPQVRSSKEPQSQATVPGEILNHC